VIVYLALLDILSQLVTASLETADLASAEINDSQAFNEFGARVTVEEK